MSQDYVDDVFSIVLIFRAKISCVFTYNVILLSLPAMLHEKEVSPNR